MFLFKKRKKDKEKEQKPPKGTVDYNARKIKKKYPVNEYGFFGEKGDNKQVIYSPKHVKDSKKFFKKISNGGKRKDSGNDYSIQKIMKDNGSVVYREKTSTPNSPAVDLGDMKGKIKNQRIHFLKKEKLANNKTKQERSRK